MHLLVALVACTPPEADPVDTGADDTALDAGDDTAPDPAGDTAIDTDPPIPWSEGELSVSGRAYFFDMVEIPVIAQVTDVEGAEVFVWEAPELRATLSPDDDHVFTIDGIPHGVELTLAIEHPDYFPGLTGVLQADDHLEGVTFQAMTQTIAGLAAGLLGADVEDDTLCNMATTVTAAGGDDVWAIGEPDATVSLTPGVSTETGPYYFGTDVIPDPKLQATTSDGGVIVVGAEPGRYVWDGHKDGVDFDPIALRCEPGWLTNASPPYALYATK